MAKNHPQDDAPPSAPWLTCLVVNRRQWIIIGVQAALIAVLVVAIVRMLPLKTIEPIYIEFQTGGNNFVVLAKGGRDIRSNEALLSRELRQYVVFRETIDKSSEEKRYKLVFQMSSDDVWRKFQLIGKQKDSLLNREGFKRDIKIGRDTSIANGVHQLEVTTTDSFDNRPDLPPIESKWLVTLEYDYEDKKVSYDERTINPTGIVITEYTVNKREN